MDKVVLILDCGATNVKACLINTSGRILASGSLPNETSPDPHFAGGLIWDMDEIWRKLGHCCRMAFESVPKTIISAVTVTTFGVDGAAVRKDGSLCYPTISWQCTRTIEVEKNIDRYLNREWLYRTTGLQSYHFNTIHKLIWLLENQPHVLQEMEFYVLISSLIIHRLSGSFVTDATMAGTTMMTNLKNRSFSGEILKKLRLPESIFPPLVEPGMVVGKVTQTAAAALGIPAGIPVVTAGHDTQFAILASGAEVNQPVLSSGTWEILMARTPAETLQVPAREAGITIELDARAGLLNLGIQWVASGVLEWFGKLLYTEIADIACKYETMMEEASQIQPGCNGVWIVPELFRGGLWGKEGNINGLTHEVNRGHIYRAAIESLCFSLGNGLEKLQAVSNHKASSLICVGGGSKNTLWNQIRADVTGIPVLVSDIMEATAMGAAMVAFTGIGIFASIDEALHEVKTRYTVFEPGGDTKTYRDLYQKYKELVMK